jgi:tRNA(Ile)-lysidine synthase
VKPTAPPGEPGDASPATLSPTWLARRLEQLIGPLRGLHLCLAFSGGLDSSVLLHALASLRRRHRLRLRALHVNHQLQPQAAAWADAAGRRARALRVPFERLDVPVERIRGESLEAAARSARYDALAGRLQPAELLLTAHHQEDQLETLLLALVRGSGVRGLSAMSAVSPWRGTRLVRPLLPVSRAELTRYAHEQRLQWSEDPSNLDERFDRNYLRRRVLPLLQARWPAVAATVGRSAAHLLEARGLLEELARSHLAPARDGPQLRVSVLRRLPEAQRRNALRYWIGERGLAPPDHRRLREIAGPMLRSRPDALTAVRWRGGELRRSGERLFALAAVPVNPGSQSWDWRRQPWLPLAQGGALGLVREPHGDVCVPALPGRLQVSFRQGGERLRTHIGRAPLKDLLRTEGLAPWERGAVPLIGDGERIIAVADLWLDPDYRTSGGGARFRWRRPAG